MDRLEATARAQERHFWFVGLRGFVEPVLRQATAHRHGLRILDCGCGTGANLPLLGRFGQVFGFDLSEIGIGYSRQACRRLAQADVTKIPFPDATFDMVTSFDVFQMLPDDRQALGEMVRVLRPDGLAVFTVTAMEALSGSHNQVWEERRRYSKASARQLAADAGLEVLRVSYLFASLVPLMYLVRSMQRRLRQADERLASSDIRVPPRLVNTLLRGVLALERQLSRAIDMPFGSSLLVVARVRGSAAGGALLAPAEIG